MSKLNTTSTLTAAAKALSATDQQQQQQHLKRTERASSENPNNTAHTQHRRHNSLSGRVCSSKSLAKSVSITDIANKLEQYEATILPDRISSLGTQASTVTTTVANSGATASVSCNRTLPKRDSTDEVDSDETRRRRLPATAATKDCLESSTSSPNAASTAVLSYDEPDHLQHRFSRTANAATAAAASSAVFSARLGPGGHNISSTLDNGFSDLGGCTSGMSSVFSSPSASTVSSPLSTPTRLSPQLHHQHNLQHQSSCCQKSSIASAKNSCTSASSSNQHNHHLHDHHHHHQQQHKHQHHLHQSPHHLHHITSSSGNGSKNPKKFDPRLGPSPYRQLLPIALCILSFATVFSILIVYMDTTEIRHQQFRLNMSRDYELYGVAQDDPQLIAFLREIHMRKYPMHFLKTRTDGGGGSEATSAVSSSTSTLGPGNGGGGGGLIGVDQHFNFSAHPNELTPKMAYYVANLLQGKTNGAVIQSLTGSLGHLMTAPWLSETLNWAGVIVEPEPRRFFTLRKQNGLRPRLQVVHACVSPNPYPKEVTVHNEESEVRINSLLDEETSWFNSRVKCFPLYTIMLASNRVEYDLLSLGVHGHELEILQTLPFEKIRIEIISIHLLENQEDVSSYVQTITKFLQRKGYKLQKKFGRNYFYQRLSTTTAAATTTATRTRKKDILLKTP